LKLQAPTSTPGALIFLYRTLMLETVEFGKKPKQFGSKTVEFGSL
jgi:hypothetical protein